MAAEEVETLVFRLAGTVLLIPLQGRGYRSLELGHAGHDSRVMLSHPIVGVFTALNLRQQFAMLLGDGRRAA